MSAFVSSLGDLAQSSGDAFEQQRAYNLALQKQQSEAALQAAQAGEAGAHSNYFNQMAARDRWQPLSAQPTLEKDGKWYMYLQDRLHGTLQKQEVGAPANSLQSTFQQLPGGAGSIDPRTMDLLVASKLGVKNPFVGMSKEMRQVGNQLYAGYVDPLTNSWTPIRDASGQPVAMGVSQAMTPVTNAQGDQVPYFYPSKTAVPGTPPAAAGKGVPTPPASLTPAVAQATAPKAAPAPPATNSAGIMTDGAGRPIKTPAKLDPQASKTLLDLQSARPMLDDLIAAINKSGKAKAGGIFDAAKTMSEYANYRMGFPTSDPFYQQAFALADLYRNNVTGAYLNGIRRGDLITKIQQHMPTATDTPAQLLQKANVLKEITPQIGQAVLDFERQKAVGVNRMANFTQPPKASASTADVQRYADQYKIPYGQALQEFQKDGVQVSAATR